MNRGLAIVQAGLAGTAFGLLIATSLPPRSYTVDLQEDYLAARALRDGIDIFTPVTQLSARYFPAPTSNFPHPNPHPPLLALMSLPLTVVPFPTVVFLWLGANAALLILVGRWMGLSPRWSLALAAWPPLWCLLAIGQFELLILALAMSGWRAAAGGRDWRAGMWLGLAAVVKLYPALLLVPFAVRGRWRLLLGAGIVLALGQVGNLVAAGPSGFVRYYEEIVPGVSAIYMRSGLNSAPYAALLRLLGGATDVSPLIAAPAAVLPATIATSLLAFTALLKLEPEAAPAAVLAALPVGWYYFAVLTLPQLIALLRRPECRRIGVLIVVALSFALPLVNLVVGWSHGVAPPMALLLAVQPAGILGLLVVSVRAKTAQVST
jgi:glycosyl transferase family 87